MFERRVHPTLVLTNYFCQKTRYVLIKEDLCPISYLFYSSFQGKSQQHLSEVEASKAASNGECAASMFSGPGKEAALRACEAQYAFQRNWYPDPIGGTYIYTIQCYKLYLSVNYPKIINELVTLKLL